MKIKKQIVIGIFTILFALMLTTICNADTAIVNTDTLKLRKEASTESTVLELLNQGQRLEILEDAGDWYKVKIKGVTGFVHKDYIKVEKTENTENIEVVQNTESTQNTIVEEQSNNEQTNTEVNTTIEENTQQNTENKVEEFTAREETLKIDAEVYILPLINSTKIESLKKDAKVTLVEKTNGWFYIQTDKINGWIRKDAIGEEKPIQTDNPTTTPTNNGTTNPDNNKPEQNKEEIKETAIEKKVLYINSPSVYVRKGPGTNYEAIDSLVLNAQVTAIAESGDWYKVQFSNVTGYIAKRLLSGEKQETTSRNSEERNVEENKEEKPVETTNPKPVVTSSKGQEIVDFAKKYLGCKYVYGGSGPSTFDCSGFTMYVYKNFGISLSHSATAQSKKGSYVAKEDLKPGDLVFFKDYETMNGIGHCGIYIGDGNFIHASSGTGYCVKISTLLSGSYLKRYETARRLV